MRILLLATLIVSTVIASHAQVREELNLYQERPSLTKSISVYPNPAVDFVEVGLDQLNANTVKLSVYNIIGNEVKVESEVIDEHKIRIRVKDFASGYYLVALQDEQTKFKGIYKFLKR
ncbi:MAG: T9SS type A sorting domain-containing protein [Cyclobacteriaceae bacterium]|jgi:hypothetical protein|nr:T9SS type A sorting domain-containing protein [Cyclobacteriaceae bacterium]